VPAWLTVSCAGLALALLTATHIWYVNRRTGKAYHRIQTSADARHPAG
jgi:hypothetical protein